ncbi:MAG: DUF4253 domain-containing protein [Planctomycetota bacterium]
MKLPEAVTGCLSSAGIPIAKEDRTEPEGSFSLLLPGSRAIDAWRALSAIADTTGLWPVVGGPPASPLTPAQLEFLAQFGPRASAGPKWSDADRSRALNAAHALTPEALLAKWKVERTILPAGTTPLPFPSVAELAGPLAFLSRTLGLDLGEPRTPFVAPWNHGTRNFHELVTLDLYPTRSPWEVPALIGFGGWNQCPLPEEHVVMLRTWHERFDADLVALTGDRIEVAVSRAPGTADDARALAAEQLGYCVDLLQGFSSPEELADTLLGLACWSFWWD